MTKQKNIKKEIDELLEGDTSPLKEYLIVVNLDLDGGKSANYPTIITEFEEIGLMRSLRSHTDQVASLPATTFACITSEYNTNVEAINNINGKIQEIFTRHELTGNVFVSVGDDWAWSSKDTRNI